jgi:hypothetical protein
MLNDIMELDHVVEIRDGLVLDGPKDVYAPEVYIDTDSEGQIWPQHEKDFISELRRQGWVLLTGYTGQSGYRGPIMHSSEFIGGRLEEDILNENGVYVACVVYASDDNYSVGWVVCKRLES